MLKTHCVTNLRASTQRCAALRAGAATVRSWQMVQWLPGVTPPSGGDRKSRVSFKMYSGSRLHPLRCDPERWVTCYLGTPN